MIRYAWKYSLRLFLTSIGCFIIAALALFAGCSTDTATEAARGDAVAIQSVNAAMTAWANYVNTGHATPSQITLVSNSYEIYYRAQLVASNATMLYVDNPSTNLAGAEALAIATAVTSQSNIIALVKAITH